MTTLNEKTNISLGWAAALIAVSLSIGFFFWDARADGKLANSRLDKLEPAEMRMEKAIYRLEVNAGTLPDDYQKPWVENEEINSPLGQKKRKR
jgi:hypothetical protein